jgi:hypothetical protein
MTRQIPPSSGNEGDFEMTTKRDQVVQQLRAVAALCETLGGVSSDLASLYESGAADELLDHVGLRSASQMEILGDMLDGMDAVNEPDEWMMPVFVSAHELFPDAVRRMGWFGAVDAVTGKPAGENSERN